MFDDNEPAENVGGFVIEAERLGNVCRVRRDDFDRENVLWFVRVRPTALGDLDLVQLEALADSCGCEGFFTRAEYEDEIRVYIPNPDWKPRQRKKKILAVDVQNAE
jgi:hypothetical protein